MTFVKEFCSDRSGKAIDVHMMPTTENASKASRAHNILVGSGVGSRESGLYGGGSRARDILKLP